MKRALPPLLAELETAACVSEEVRWLQENSRLLNTALQDTAELAKLKKTPHVRRAGGRAVPRIAAVAESYWAAVHYRFEARAFAAYLDALQENVVLNIAEVWALVPCLKLLLLEEITARALRLRRDLGGEYGVADCIRSLHHVGQTGWKDVLEPRILVDRVLREDPAGAYAEMDFESRDRYWNAVGEIAAHSDLSEADIAVEAVSLAQEGDAARARNHTDPRLAARARACRLLSGRRRRSSSPPQGWVPPGFAGENHVVPAPSSQRLLPGGHRRAHPGDSLGGAAAGGWRRRACRPLLLALLALLLPASQVAVELMNCVTTWLLPVQFLPKLDFSAGIPTTVSPSWPFPPCC